MTRTQKNVIKVLERMIDHVKEYEDDAEVFAEHLQIMLDELHSMDFFGAEGEMDPRGDFRDKPYSMNKVQGA